MTEKRGSWPGAGARLAGVVASLLMALACAAPGTQGSGEPEPSSRTPGTQADGTMTAEEFEGDIEAAVGVAEWYWGERFRDMGRGFEPVHRVVAYRRAGEVACAGRGLPRNNAVYCSAGDFIAYDVDWAVAAFQRVGDAFLFYLLGHEYAHGVQVRLGVRYDFTIQQELQADCMAGAYIGDSVRADSLALQDGDLDELRNGLLAVGDDPGQPWFAEGAHGSAEERTESFFAGYERSLDACGL